MTDGRIVDLAARIERIIAARIEEWRKHGRHDCLLCLGEGWMWGPALDRAGRALPGPDQPIRCPICAFVEEVPA